MDAVLTAPAFEPAGLVTGVWSSEAAPHSTRGQHCLGADVPALNDEDALRFCLFTVDVFEGPLQRLGPDDFDTLSLASNDELDAKLAALETMRAAAAAPSKSGAAPRRAPLPPDAFNTKICLTGHLENGLKVGIWVPFRPFCYVLVPEDAAAAAVLSSSIISPAAFDARVMAPLLESFKGLSVEYQRKPKFLGYVPASREEPTTRRKFLWARIACPSTAVMRRVVRALRLEEGAWPWREPHEVWEDGIDTAQKFLDAHGLEPSGWHELKPGAWTLCRERALLVDVEVQIADARVIQRVPSETRVPSLSIVVLDCEMNSHTATRFPKANRPNNEVVVVSGVFAYAGALPGALATAGATEYIEYERRAWVLGACCDPIPGVIVECFADEWSLLAAVRDECFVHKRVDVVSGHNVIRFDVPYMYRRVALFGSPEGKRFLRFGVLNTELSLHRSLQPREPRAGEPRTSAFAPKSTKIQCPGVAFVDTMLVCKSEKKLTQNTLSAACEAFLKQGAAKFDMPYELIPAVCTSTDPDSWSKLVAYCVQDSVLVLRLLQKWDKVKDLVAQSRIMNVPMAINTQCGQQERVRDYLMKDAHAGPNPYVMNGVNDTRNPRPAVPHIPATGGWVLDNVPGLHDKPVVVLDFASLYPSVQMAKNLCYSTVVRDPALIGMPGLSMEEFRTDTGTFWFVQSPEGVAPNALRTKRAERSAYKRAMVTHSYGSPEYAVCSNAEKAIKIPMNSLYGAANVSEDKGVMPCRALGTVTTFVGRQLNGMSAEFLVKTFGAVLLYGDTDSVFVYFPEPEGFAAGVTRLERLKYAMARGEEAEHALNAHINAKFGTRDVRVEFEKVYFPWVSARKKTYAGLKFEPGDDAKANADLTVGGRLECKGIRTVRRDVPGFIRRINQSMFDALFIARDLDVFWHIIHSTAEDLCTPGKLSLADFVITAELKAGYAAQVNVTAQTAVSYAREYAQPGTAFSAGDRVPYVVVIEADDRRLVRPPWMNAEILDEDAIWSDADSSDEEDAHQHHGAGSAVRTCYSTLKSARARHPDEVIKAPHANHLDVVHYVKALCSVLEQLMPHEEKAREELVRYAQAAQVYNAYREALLKPSTDGAAACFPVQAQAPPLKLSHKQPGAPESTRVRNLFGEWVDVRAAPKSKATASALRKRPAPDTKSVQTTL